MEASISAEIELSISIIDSAILSTVLKFNPNFLAAIAALAKLSPPSIENLAKVSVLSAISFNTAAGATRLALAKLPTVSNVAKFVSIEAPLIPCIVLSNLPALSPLKPNCPVILPKPADTLADITSIEPKFSAIEVTAASACSTLPPKRFAFIPASFILPAILADSTADTPNDCLTSKAF